MMRIFVYLCILWLSGCSRDFNFDGLMNMKRLSDNRSRMDAEVRKQEKLFFKLVDDIQNGRLQKGVRQEAIISSYGKPIFAKAVTNKPGMSEVLFYRHPTEFFSSDWIHLYFDGNKRLVSWEFVPLNR